MPLFRAAASDDGPITYLNVKMVVIKGVQTVGGRGSDRARWQESDCLLS